MQVFVVFDISETEVVDGRVHEHYPGNYHKTPYGSLFIATKDETTQNVGEKLGMGEENLSSGIVVPVSAYWGRANPAMWEWIGVKLVANGK